MGPSTCLGTLQTPLKLIGARTSGVAFVGCGKSVVSRWKELWKDFSSCRLISASSTHHSHEASTTLEVATGTHASSKAASASSTTARSKSLWKRCGAGAHRSGGTKAALGEFTSLGLFFAPGYDLFGCVLEYVICSSGHTPFSDIIRIGFEGIPTFICIFLYRACGMRHIPEAAGVHAS